MDRLSADAPEIAEKLNRASESERASLVHFACQQAVAATDLKDPAATKALAMVALGTPNRSMSMALADLADALDTSYFDARERGDPSWPELFGKARAATALAAALSNDSEAAAKAIYEAAHAAKDLSSIYSLIAQHDN